MASSLMGQYSKKPICPSIRIFVIIASYKFKQVGRNNIQKSLIRKSR